MVLAVYRTVSESGALIIVFALLQIVCVIVMNQRTAYLVGTFGGNDPPDLWFGIKGSRLYDYVAGIGKEGRSAYLSMVQWDVMPTMPTYSTLLGSLTYKECKKAGLSPKWSLVFFLAVICDLIETLGCGYVAKNFPMKYKKNHLLLVSYGNQLKWISLAVGITAFALLFLTNLISRKASSKPVTIKEQQQKKPKTTEANTEGPKEADAKKEK